MANRIKRTSGADTASSNDGKPATGPDIAETGADARETREDGGSAPATGGKPEPLDIGGYPSIEPSSIPIEPTRRKGRRSKAELLAAGYYANKPGASSAAAAVDSLVDLTTLLMSLHQMGAALLNIAELELEKEEAQNLADAVKEVARFYPMAISPKKMAIANLVIVAGGIYGTRAIAYRNRAMVARADHQERAKARVVDMSGQPAAGGPNGAPGAAAMNPSEIWPLAPDENISL